MHFMTWGLHDLSSIIWWQTRIYFYAVNQPKTCVLSIINNLFQWPLSDSFLYIHNSVLPFIVLCLYKLLCMFNEQINYVTYYMAVSSEYMLAMTKDDFVLQNWPLRTQEYSSTKVWYQKKFYFKFPKLINKIFT